MKFTNTMNVNIDKCRKLVQHYIDLHMLDTALFWADKVVTLTDNPRDIYWQAKCMYHLKQYHRAVHLLKSRKLNETYILCNYLTIKCLYEANDLNEALNAINSLDSQLSTLPSNNVKSLLFDDLPKNQVFSSIFFLKGKIMESLDNRIVSVQSYRQALKHDVYCFEAFDALTRNQMLTSMEEKELLKFLPIAEQCTPEEGEILRFLYETKLKKYHESSIVAVNTVKISRADHMLLDSNVQLNITPCVISNLTPNFLSTPSVSTPNLPMPKNEEESDKNEKNLKAMETEGTEESEPSCLEKLKGNLEVLTAHAERHYYNCEFSECVHLTDQILNEDPWHIACLPVHISCCVELKDSNRIFLLAHNLVDLYPNMAISWYAVGCYYYILGKGDCARRYFMKATCLDKLFGPAWLAYGHSFALENEHDQAMAAYFKASQLMKGCHLPFLYIGLECGLTNNVRLAEKFFVQAHNIAPDDPFVLHEKGVINYQNLEFEKAEKYFKTALNKITSNNKTPLPPRWATLLINLGHTIRKLKRYNEALEFYMMALVLLPRNASVYSSIGFVHSLLGNLEEAVDWFHKALGLDRADTFSSTMLNCLMEELADCSSPYEGAPMEIPKYIPRDIDSLPPATKANQRNTNKDISMSAESSLEYLRESFESTPPRVHSPISTEVDMETTGEED